MSNRLLARNSKPLIVPGLKAGMIRNESAPSMADIAASVTAINRAFEAFKAKNDEALAELKKNKADAITTEHVDRINADITRITGEMSDMATKVAAARTAGTGDSKETPEAAAHKKAFRQMLRRGTDAGLNDLAIKAALSTDSDPDGGYVVPEEIDNVITRVLGTLNSVRAISSNINVSTGMYKKIHNLGGTSSGWVGEKGARPQTNTPQLAEMAFPTMELYAMPAATQAMLDDAVINTEQWLGGEVATQFAEQEGDAYVNGDGVNKPRGFLNYDKAVSTPAAPSAWGKIGFTNTGASGAFAANPNGYDAMLDLIYSLKAGYRADATLVMNDATLAMARKLKDSQGEYQWQPPVQAGEPSLLLGYPVAHDDNMPNFAANAFPIAFGNFKRGYLVVDRIGTRVLRDPYSTKPYVLFYTTRRVGGGVQDYHAIKLLKAI